MSSSDWTKSVKLLSPCVSICEIDPNDGMCRGCFRSLEEIAAWPGMSQEDQMLLLEALRDRRAQVTGLRRRPSRHKL